MKRNGSQDGFAIGAQQPEYVGMSLRWPGLYIEVISW